MTEPLLTGKYLDSCVNMIKNSADSSGEHWIASKARAELQGYQEALAIFREYYLATETFPPERDAAAYSRWLSRREVARAEAGKLMVLIFGKEQS